MVSVTTRSGRKITDKIAALAEDAPYYSFEFFPPKTQAVRMPRTIRPVLGLT